MKKRSWQVFALLIAATICTSVLAQAGKWGEPLPDPRKPQPGAKPAAGGPGCFAYRTKGGNSFQIACYPAGCDSAKTSYAQGHANIEAIGCAAQLYCFAYNNGTSSACYTDGNECVTARNDVARRASNVGACARYDKSGNPATGAVQAQAGAADQPSCFAYTYNQGRVPNVFCTSSKQYCDEREKSKDTGSGPSSQMNIKLSCTSAPLYCFAYNKGADGACYQTSAACESNRRSVASATPCKPYTSGVVN